MAFTVPAELREIAERVNEEDQQLKRLLKEPDVPFDVQELIREARVHVDKAFDALSLGSRVAQRIGPRRAA